MTGRQCEVCGDVIRNPVPRERGRIICCDCWGDRRNTSIGVGSGIESGEAADRQYHGGMFNRGEW